MPRFGHSIVLFLLPFVLLTMPATAQLTPTELLPGQVGIFADEAATLSRIEGLDPLTPADAYVVVGAPGPIDAFELGLMTYAPELFITRAEFDGVFDVDEDENEFLVGLGECRDGTENLVLLRLSFLYFSAAGRRDDLVICLTGVDPSSFDDIPGFSGGTPGYSQCDGGIRPFGVAQNGSPPYPDGCLVINPTVEGPPIGTEAIGFGLLKARF